MKFRFWFVLTGMLLAAIAAGCGSSGGKTVAVNMREFSFSPAGITVPAGAEVTLNIKNLGALDHNFHIMDLGSEIEDAWEEGDEDRAVVNQDIIPGGETVSLSFTAPTVPGEYQFLCSIPAHFEQGMSGTMTVTEP